MIRKHISYFIKSQSQTIRALCAPQHGTHSHDKNFYPVIKTDFRIILTYLQNRPLFSNFKFEFLHSQIKGTKISLQDKESAILKWQFCNFVQILVVAGEIHSYRVKNSLNPGGLNFSKLSEL